MVNQIYCMTSSVWTYPLYHITLDTDNNEELPGCWCCYLCLPVTWSLQL